MSIAHWRSCGHSVNCAVCQPAVLFSGIPGIITIILKTEKYCDGMVGRGRCVRERVVHVIDIIVRNIFKDGAK